MFFLLFFKVIKEKNLKLVSTLGTYLNLNDNTKSQFTSLLLHLIFFK